MGNQLDDDDGKAAEAGYLVVIVVSNSTIDSWLLWLLVDHSLFVSLGILNTLELTLTAANEGDSALTLLPSLICCPSSMIPEGAKELRVECARRKTNFGAMLCRIYSKRAWIYAGFRPCRGMLACLRSGRLQNNFTLFFGF